MSKISSGFPGMIDQKTGLHEMVHPTMVEEAMQDKRDRRYDVMDVMDISNFLGAENKDFTEMTGVDFMDALEDGLVMDVMTRTKILGVALASGNQHMMAIIKRGGEPIGDEPSDASADVAATGPVPGAKGPAAF